MFVFEERRFFQETVTGDPLDILMGFKFTIERLMELY
jgi:hypothetical protein